ncbi:MAG: tyrosine-type recombinase/integrase [Lachnospiraceae bacterium]|nr:tyrosine-type recombinase/integrase [Lachnospiraceae bacterium]
MFLATGIRSGELCVLHWDDIDFQTGVLYISHTMVRLD